jgi:branched-chain amino acid transport system ATP-binding protein
MAELLRLADVSAGYGEAVVLSDLSLALNEGDAVALLGRNGMGKTTLVNTIIGQTSLQRGRIAFAGSDVTALPSHRRAALGIGWVPQERDIFRSLTVEENISAVARSGPWNLERLYALFPRLAERQRSMGDQLSGGEQQMLAIARALALNPRLLLLDEPLEGLAPIIIEELLRVLDRLVREERLTMIVIEQHAAKVLAITERAVLLERGRIVHDGPSAGLVADPAPLSRHLGVGAIGKLDIV